MLCRNKEDSREKRVRRPVDAARAAKSGHFVPLVRASQRGLWNYFFQRRGERTREEGFLFDEKKFFWIMEFFLL